MNLTLLSVGVVTGLLMSGLALSGCSHPEQTRPSESPGAAAAQPADSVIRLSPQAVRRSGLQILTVVTRPGSHEIISTGEIRVNDNRVFRISSLAGGRVISDRVMLGDVIRQGQTLGVVQNLEVARIQANYIHELHQNEVEVAKARAHLALANRTLAREKRLLAEGISPRKDYYQAETDATIARIQLDGEREHAILIRAEGRALLEAYGMSPGNLASETIRTATPVVAPRSGVITQKTITVGSVVTPQTVLYEVADLSQVWLDVAVYPQDVASVRTGQPVTFVSDTMPGQRFTGRIDYLPPAASATSPTFIARAFLQNPDGLLKPGMFGMATIAQPGQDQQPWLSDSAIQKYGPQTFVFQVLKPGQYLKKPVTLGSKLGDGYFIDKGLHAGDRVVGQGSFTLKAILMKSQFAEEQE